MDDKAFRQNLKVIISECIMVIAVIITVCALAFIVSGYWVNSDFKIERNGMIQVSSVPTGANLEIDGESSWLRRTNTSKILSSGEHNIIISKDDYDSWSKTVDISEGLLYRLNYPRLFLKERKIERIYDAMNYTYATVSSDHSRLLLIGDTTSWSLLDLRQETISTRVIDVASIINNSQIANEASVSLFNGKIVSAEWNRGNERVLLQINQNGKDTWVIIDTGDLDNSVNISRTFNRDFASITPIDRNEYLAVMDGNLVKLDIRDKIISEPIKTNVYDFQLSDNKIIYSIRNESEKYDVGRINLDGSHDDFIGSFDGPALVKSFKFYEEYYLAIATNGKMILYDIENHEDPINAVEFDFSPESITAGREGEFVVVSTGNNLATIDMEANSTKVWQVLGESFDWLDGYMPYTIQEGELIVYDFDGLNQRSLAKNVSSRFPAAITDNKWLYYFSDGNLVREWLTK